MTKRKRQAAPSISRLLGAIAALEREARGVLDLAIVRVETMPVLMAAAMGGDIEAETLVEAAATALRHLEAETPDAPMRCGSCSRPLRETRFSFVVCTAPAPSDGRGLVLAICRHCGITDWEIFNAARRALSAIWTDVRPAIIHEPGHA